MIDQDLVIRLFKEGKSYRAICKASGASETYVKQIIFRARKKGILPPAVHLTEEERDERGTDKRLVNVGQTPEEYAEKALAHWEQSPVAVAMTENKAGINRAAGAFVMECIKLGQTVDKRDPEQLMNALYTYVALCTQAGMPMLVKTACLACGLNRQDLNKWRKGEQRASDPRYKEFADAFEAIVGAGLEASAAAGAVDRVLTIWWQKAYMGMTEAQPQQQEVEEPLGQRVNSEDIVKKYSGLPD